MSEPVTLYGLNDKGWYYRVGSFVERAWCATHDLPMVDGTCMGITSRRCVPEPLPRLVQEPK